jgi:hypothetical protein
MRVRPRANRGTARRSVWSSCGQAPRARPQRTGLCGRTTLHVAVPSHPKVVRFAGHGVCAPKSGAHIAASLPRPKLGPNEFEAKLAQLSCMGRA